MSRFEKSEAKKEISILDSSKPDKIITDKKNLRSASMKYRFKYIFFSHPDPNLILSVRYTGKLCMSLYAQN